MAKKQWSFREKQVIKRDKPLYNRGFTCILLSSRLRVMFLFVGAKVQSAFFTRNRKPDFSYSERLKDVLLHADAAVLCILLVVWLK